VKSTKTSFDGRGLLIDTNLMVLFIVGTVNRNRIESFKRTSKYSKEDYDLLAAVIESLAKPLYTVAHVLAEVSNLTDLTGKERIQARYLLKETVALLEEPVMASMRAAEAPEYQSLGLVDAAIATVAKENNCAVLTDDLDLYLALLQKKVAAYNFTYLQADAWGI
jgi:hypothetical protein